MDRSNREHAFKAEAGKFHNTGLCFVGINLVNSHQDRLSALAQALGDFTVQGQNPFLNIDDEDDDVCRIDGDTHLLNRSLSDDVVSFFAAQQADAAGVHEGKRPATPLGFGCNAVAGHARLVMHDGNPPPYNAVEERGLADVWPADDGDEIRHMTKMGHLMQNRKGKK